MKRIIFAVIIFLALIGTAFAESPACISSGLQTADATIATKASGYYNCLCGVEVVPAAADATLVVYDNTSAAGTVLFKAVALASTTPNGYPPNGQCIAVTKGIYADVTGAGAAYIIWYR
jgi:hypothetical protein